MKPAPVLLVSNMLHLPSMVGYNRYSVSMSRALAPMLDRELVWVPMPPGVHPAIRAQLPGTVAPPIRPGLLPKSLDWSGADRRLRPALWHVLTDLPVPWFVRGPVVVTCHGLPRLLRHRHMIRDGHLSGTVWDYQDFPPSLGAKKSAARHAAATYVGLRRATAIVAVSEYVRWELVNKFGIRAGKIHVVYHAADPVFEKPRPRDEVEAVRAKYGLPPRFALAVASFSRTKNTGGLIRLARALAGEPGVPPLVLVGPAGTADHYARQGAELGLAVGRSLWMLERIPDDDLACVYRAADVFVNLAWEESYGLPIVEAMAGGTPVVASDKTAVPEVVGGGGLVVDPRDDGAVARAVRRVLDDAELRAELRAKALRRAADFSWEKTARGVLAVYDAVSPRG